MRKVLVMSVFALGSVGLVACGSETVASDKSSVSATVVNGNWEVDNRDSHIKFTATQQGTAFTGEFTDFTADINFNADDLGEASVEAVINLASVEAGDSERNSALPGKDWFHVKKYPTATFTSDDFQKLADGEYEARGSLTIRDVENPVTLPFTLEITGDEAVMKGSLSLDRSDYGVGQGSYKTDEWVGFDVDVDIAITANRR
jgi:polyisoprenoid-binding protein YceI